MLERSSELGRVNAGGGIGLWPPSLFVLHQLGVLQRLEREGAYMPSPSYRDIQGRLLAQPSPNFSERFPVLCLERAALLRHLLEECERLGIEVLSGCSLENFELSGAEGSSHFNLFNEKIIKCLRKGY